MCERLLGLSAPPSSSVRRQLALPIKLGGFGLRSAVSLSPIAFYASLASSLPFIVSSPSIRSYCGSSISGVVSSSSVSDVHISPSLHSASDSRLGGAPVALPSSFPLLSSLAPFFSLSPLLSRFSLPTSVPTFWSTFSCVSPPPRLQRLLTSELDMTLFRDHSDFVGTSPVASRAFASASHSTSRYWLSCLPSSPSSRDFTLSSRLRLFLPPSDSLPIRCACSDPLSDPTHFLSCERLQDLRLTTVLFACFLWFSVLVAFVRLSRLTLLPFVLTFLVSSVLSPLF